MKKDYGDKMKSTETHKRLSERLAGRPAYSIGAGILLLAIVLLLVGGGGRGPEQNDDPLFTVKSGPLTISVSESGRLKNKDEIILKNETSRSLKILVLAEEGTMVKKGDIIVELDGANLETARDNGELNIKRIESDLTSAQKQREILQNQKQADIEKAALNLKFAKLDLKRFTEGVHPKNLEAAEALITMAEANLERAEKDHMWSIKLLAKGFITERDLKADELTAKQYKINLKNRKTELDLLVQFTHPQAIESMESTVTQNEMALQRAKLRSEAELTGQMAGLFHHEIKLENGKKELEKAQTRLDACKIAAPADGMVIFGTSGGEGRERDRMEVGATVHPMHKLIRMPMSSIMLAEMSVQEATKPKLHESMPAVVTVDALPGRVFTGKLTEIGILPDATQSWLNPDLKVYKCEVELDSGNNTMRPGMNCQVDIVIEEYKKAFFVPIQCVVHVDGKPTVYLKETGSITKRSVKTGMDNSVMIHILSGLEDGDKVMLDPPLDEAMKKNETGLATDKPAEESTDQGTAESTGKNTVGT
ncbi:MAG TPA: efflux transporter periplasmic adaptor subunit [Verrucomicrobia bacterium]|nr:efflux transporter periplasmic adaptor subunit [Verrucomicrobiota bacterium]